MNIEFDIDKIVNYLSPHKEKLPDLYKWKINTDKLENLIEKEEREEINNTPTDYEKAIKLKKILEEKLNEAIQLENGLFDKLCLWIIKDWGGIKAAIDENTIKLIGDFLNSNDKPDFKRIASSSKIGSFLYPEKNIIYDSRVAYAINWIILSQNAGQKYFPIPEGRNSKMSAFDLNVLIRLKNISRYQPIDDQHLKEKYFIRSIDNQIFIDRKLAYFELNKLIKQVNQQLWKGNKEKEKKLYYTEMLLFSMADKEIYKDITKNWSNLIN